MSTTDLRSIGIKKGEACGLLLLSIPLVHQPKEHFHKQFGSVGFGAAALALLVVLFEDGDVLHALARAVELGGCHVILDEERIHAKTARQRFRIALVGCVVDEQQVEEQAEKHADGDEHRIRFLVLREVHAYSIYTHDVLTHYGVLQLEVVIVLAYANVALYEFGCDGFRAFWHGEFQLVKRRGYALQVGADVLRQHLCRPLVDGHAAVLDVVRYPCRKLVIPYGLRLEH